MEDKRKQIFNWLELEESENINIQTNKQTNIKTTITVILKVETKHKWRIYLINVLLDMHRTPRGFNSSNHQC